MGHPGPFFVYYGLFLPDNTIFTTNQREQCPSSKHVWDLNPRPTEIESPPITARPGLLAICGQSYKSSMRVNYDTWNLLVITTLKS